MFATQKKKQKKNYDLVGQVRVSFAHSSFDPKKNREQEQEEYVLSRITHFLRLLSLFSFCAISIAKDKVKLSTFFFKEPPVWLCVNRLTEDQYSRKNNR